MPFPEKKPGWRVAAFRRRFAHMQQPTKQHAVADTAPMRGSRLSESDGAATSSSKGDRGGGGGGDDNGGSSGGGESGGRANVGTTGTTFIVGTDGVAVTVNPRASDASVSFVNVRRDCATVALASSSVS